MAKEEESAKEKRAGPEKTPKPVKIKKAPWFYKKTLTEKKLTDKYLRPIEQKADRDFIRSCYEEREGLYYIRGNLDEKEVRRLKALQKDIKTNRKSAVNFLPLGVAAAVAAALVIFFAFFADPLLEKALETGLEAVFDARVDADNFRLRLIKFEVTMDGLAIADRDSPMKNLFQFSRMAIRLKPQAVLRGKVYIEEIRADAIRFGTDRTVSGALPDKPPKEKPVKARADTPPLVDLRNFDAMALLDREFDKLQTLRIYDDAIGVYDRAVEKWTGQVEGARSKAGELSAQARPLLALNINDYRSLDRETIEKARATIEQITVLVHSVEEAADQVNDMISGIQADIDTASGLVRDAGNAVSGDLAHLRSYLDLGSGAAMEVLEPVIREVLSDSAETYLDLGLRALEILEKVKAMQARQPKSAPAPEEQAVKFAGRDVVFPTRSYPGFYLGTLAADVLTPGDWHWGFDLEGVSSDPDLSARPTTLKLALEEAGGGLRRAVAFNGLADFRSNAQERFNAEFNGSGFPVSLGAQLSKIGIGSYSGDASFGLAAAGFTDGGFTGGGTISLAGSRLHDPSNTLAQAISEAVAEVRSLDLGIEYEHSASESDRFSLTTNIGSLVADAMKQAAAQYIRRAEEEIEKALRAKINRYIDGRFVSRQELDLVFQAVRGDKSALDGLKNSLSEKGNAFRRQIEDAAAQVLEDVKKQAEEEARETARDLLEGKTPSIPSLPNFPGSPFR
ncbi:MAG: hypothetical protein LBQ67_07125 [Treponema sp.]|jgi:uncharacterized protein (TIGR03545 family)|nr:hypothetical protein [Treponema sp.]